MRSKILGLWILRLSNALRSSFEVVGRMPPLNLGPQQQPISAWFSKWHSHATRVHDSSLSGRTIKLHMSMPADHERRVNSLKDRQQHRVWRQTREYLGVVSWCGMAKQHPAQAENPYLEGRRPTGNHALLFWRELLRCPAYNLSSLFGERTALRPRHLGQYRNFAISSNEFHWTIQVE